MLHEAAPAKLNLDLLVTGRRADGYHLLDSLVTFVDVGDRLTFAHAPELCLKVMGSTAGALPEAEENIVLRAARRLAETVGMEPRAAITLDKRLPVAAGVGGGSADAAATLRGLCCLWEVNLLEARLAELALGLGADVPVCLHGRPARMRGIGEQLEPLADLPALDLVLVNPRMALSTAAVFRALDFTRCGPRTAELVWQRSRNDLEAPARRLLSVIGEVLEALRAAPGCALARMSGSGPTCFGLFADAEAARAAAAALQEAHPGWWVAACRSLAAS